MAVITPESRKEVLKWVGINALIGFSIPLFYATENYFSLDGWSRIWDDILFSFLMSMGISSAVGINEGILNRHFPWLKHAGKRLILEILGVSLFGFTAAFLVNVIFYSLFGMINYSDFPWRYLFNNSLVPVGVGYIITFFFISRGFLHRAKVEAVRAEKLQTEKFRSEVRVLKDQLNPHFLFNALNVLTNLVYEDADQSADYIRNLSRFYRYVLEVQDEDLVDLERELKFSRDYLRLQQERFGENALQYRENLLPEGSFQIPPLALQLLIENALKHNRCSVQEPLILEIKQDEDHLIIRNNLQKRVVEGDHLGIGLNNLSRRYELIKCDPPIIEETEAYFTVKLPLIPKK